MEIRVFEHKSTREDISQKNKIATNSDGIFKIEAPITNLWINNNGSVVVRFLGAGAGNIEIYVLNVYFQLNVSSIKSLNNDHYLMPEVKFLANNSLKHDTTNEGFLETLSTLFKTKKGFVSLLNSNKNNDDYRLAPITNFLINSAKIITVNDILSKEISMELYQLEPNYCAFNFKIDLPNRRVTIIESDKEYREQIMNAFRLTTLLNEDELKICKELSLDTDLAGQIKKISNSSILKCQEYDSGTGEEISNNGTGIAVKLELDVDAFLGLQKKSFLAKGYLLFVNKNDAGEKYLTIIKGTTELDIIKYRMTNGENHGLSNTQLIEKLKSWHEEYEMEIFEIGIDFISLTFNKQIVDVDLFAIEMYKLCPDIVEQGSKTVKKLASQIKKDNGVHLWWD